LISENCSKWHDFLIRKTILESREMNNQLSAKNIPHSAGHVWFMSFIVTLLLVMALAAATRLPLYLATGDIWRFVGTSVFNLLALVGLVDNLHTHMLFWQAQNQVVAQPV
jgi:uncharacterized membrane protein